MEERSSTVRDKIDLVMFSPVPRLSTFLFSEGLPEISRPICMWHPSYCSFVLRLLSVSGHAAISSLHLCTQLPLCVLLASYALLNPFADFYAS
jgi:hypothetical protein